MKPCHEMVLQFMLEGPPPRTILCFNVHTTVSIGQLFQHISKSYVLRARLRPKIPTKTYNKEVCQT